MERNYRKSVRIPRIDPGPSSSLHHNSSYNSTSNRRKTSLPSSLPPNNMDYSSRSLRRMTSSQPKNRNGAGHFYLKVAVHNRLLKMPQTNLDPPGSEIPSRPPRIYRLSEIVAQCYGPQDGRRKALGAGSPLLYTPAEPKKKTDMRRESYRNRQRYYPARPAAADIEWAIDVARSHWMQEIGPPSIAEQEMAFGKKKPAFWTRLLLLLSLRNNSRNESASDPHICVSTVEGRCEVCDILML